MTSLLLFRVLVTMTKVSPGIPSPSRCEQCEATIKRHSSGLWSRGRGRRFLGVERSRANRKYGTKEEAQHAEPLEQLVLHNSCLYLQEHTIEKETVRRGQALCPLRVGEVMLEKLSETHRALASPEQEAGTRSPSSRKGNMSFLEGLLRESKSIEPADWK